MPSARLRHQIYAGAIVVLGPLASAFFSPMARADHAPPTATIHPPTAVATKAAAPSTSDRQPFARREESFCPA